jgi:hypothetical protein
MTEQMFWNIGLMVCWLIVGYGQYHQGKIVQQGQSCNNVSIRLPVAVFTAQCILLVKGIYYTDWSLIGGFIVVNLGVGFNLFQIAKIKFAKRK